VTQSRRSRRIRSTPPDTVGLHGRTHEVHDPLELVQAIGPLGVAQLGLGVGHHSILPCPGAGPFTSPSRTRQPAQNQGYSALEMMRTPEQPADRKGNEP
jgi:hypothetical protein